MTFTITQGEEPASLTLAGELDIAEADSLIERASSSIPDDADLVLDVRDLSFIDSSGVRALVTIAGMLRSGHRLVLQEPTPAVRRVLDLVGIGETAAGIAIRGADDR